MSIFRRFNRVARAALAVSASAVAGISLAGCQPSSPQGGAPSNPAAFNATHTSALQPGAPRTLQVALLTPGDINDGGWNQLAYEGLQAVHKQLGAQISSQVTKNAADQEPALRDYADRHYDLIICHGFEYGEHVKAIAVKYPGTKFVVVGGNVKQSPNVATLVPKLEDATYLLGMVAGGLSKTGTSGLIGGAKLPVITSTFEAFEQGAKAINPRAKVLTNYIGNFEDQNAAKEAARSMIAGGADVLFHNADQAGKGMFTAASDAQNVWVFGSNRNQNASAPSICLGSAVIEMPRAFVDLAESVMKNTFKPEFVELNLPRKTIMVEWNPALKSKIPAALMQKVMAAQAEIVSGKLKIKRNVSE